MRFATVALVLSAIAAATVVYALYSAGQTSASSAGQRAVAPAYQAVPEVASSEMVPPPVRVAADLERVNSPDSAGRCSLLVVDERQRPLAGVSLRLAKSGQHAPAIATTGADGVMSVTHVRSPGNYAVTSQEHCPAFVRLPLDDGLHRLTLHDGCMLAVEVRSGGSQVANAWVSLAEGRMGSAKPGMEQLLPSDEGGCVFWARTTADGFARFRHLPAAAMTVDVHEEEFVLANHHDQVEVGVVDYLLVAIRRVRAVAMRLGERPIEVRTHPGEFDMPLRAASKKVLAASVPGVDYLGIGFLPDGVDEGELMITYVGSISGKRRTVAGRVQTISGLQAEVPRLISEEQLAIPGVVDFRVRHGGLSIEGVKVMLTDGEGVSQILVSGTKKPVVPGVYKCTAMARHCVLQDLPDEVVVTEGGEIPVQVAIATGHVPIKLRIPLAEEDRFGFDVRVSCGSLDVMFLYGRRPWITLPQGEDLLVEVLSGGKVVADKRIDYPSWSVSAGAVLDVELRRG